MKLKKDQIAGPFFKSESTGTDNYFNNKSHFFKYTDGVKDCIRLNECYWTIDFIASHYKKISMHERLTIYFMVRENQKCDFYATDGNHNIIVQDEIPWTTLNISLRFFLDYGVLFMFEEY